MVIEEKNLSSEETILFFPTPLPIRGTFYHSPNTSSASQLLDNIAQTNLAHTLLLTTDFLYIKSQAPNSLEDLTTLALAEIDDYLETQPREVRNLPTCSLKVSTSYKLLLFSVLGNAVLPFIAKEM